jgi:hypothetical protein
MIADHTGFSAPSSGMDISPLVSDTPSGSTYAKPAAEKKCKTTEAYDAQVAASSAGAAPTAPALAATSKNVELHNAAQAQVVSSSSSSYSAATSERHPRLVYASAKAKRELADARELETRLELEMGTSSHAGSVGRLHDVRSDGGASARARRRDDDAGPNDYDEAAGEQPTTDRGNHYDQHVAVRGLEGGTHPMFPVLLPRKRDHLRALPLLLVRTASKEESHHRSLHLRPKQPPHQQHMC